MNTIRTLTLLAIALLTPAAGWAQDHEPCGPPTEEQREATRRVAAAESEYQGELERRPGTDQGCGDDFEALPAPWPFGAVVAAQVLLGLLLIMIAVVERVYAPHERARTADSGPEGESVNVAKPNAGVDARDGESATTEEDASSKSVSTADPSSGLADANQNPTLVASLLQRAAVDRAFRAILVIDLFAIGLAAFGGFMLYENGAHDAMQASLAAEHERKVEECAEAWQSYRTRLVRLKGDLDRARGDVARLQINAFALTDVALLRSVLQQLVPPDQLSGLVGDELLNNREWRDRRLYAHINRTARVVYSGAGRTGHDSIARRLEWMSAVLSSEQPTDWTEAPAVARSIHDALNGEEGLWNTVHREGGLRDAIQGEGGILEALRGEHGLVSAVNGSGGLAAELRGLREDVGRDEGGGLSGLRLAVWELRKKVGGTGSHRGLYGEVDRLRREVEQLRGADATDQLATALARRVRCIQRPADQATADESEGESNDSAQPRPAAAEDSPPATTQ